MDKFKKVGLHVFGEYSWTDKHEGILSKDKPKARRISRHRLSMDDKREMEKDEEQKV